MLPKSASIQPRVEFLEFGLPSGHRHPDRAGGDMGNKRADAEVDHVAHLNAALHANFDPTEDESGTLSWHQFLVHDPQNDESTNL